MKEPLEIEIGDYTFHVIVTGWPSRGGATSPPYGADWHLVGSSCPGARVSHDMLNDRVQEAVADWAEQEDNRR